MSNENDTKTKEQKITELSRRLFDLDDKVEPLKFNIIHHNGRVIVICDLTPAQKETLELTSEGTGIPLDVILEDVFSTAAYNVADLANPNSGRLEGLADDIEPENNPKAKARVDLFAATAGLERQRKARAMRER
ncbi:MAG: hypothetical protein ABSE62_03090 [Chthoniobacteraceae bacterium]|jgi:hypothetical protein